MEAQSILRTGCFLSQYSTLPAVQILSWCDCVLVGLVSLGLADNVIGNSGAAALAELVRQSDTLETLVLSGNDIGNEGGSMMIAALAQNTSLKALYMAHVSHVTCAHVSHVTCTIVVCRW